MALWHLTYTTGIVMESRVERMDALTVTWTTPSGFRVLLVGPLEGAKVVDVSREVNGIVTMAVPMYDGATLVDYVQHDVDVRRETLADVLTFVYGEPEAQA